MSNKIIVMASLSLFFGMPLYSVLKPLSEESLDYLTAPRLDIDGLVERMAIPGGIVTLCKIQEDDEKDSIRKKSDCAVWQERTHQFMDKLIERCKERNEQQFIPLLEAWLEVSTERKFTEYLAQKLLQQYKKMKQDIPIYAIDYSLRKLYRESDFVKKLKNFEFDKKAYAALLDQGKQIVQQELAKK